MWKCDCGEVIEDQFETCWHCDRPKPEHPVEVSGEIEPAAGWANNFREEKQEDGTYAVTVFGHDLTCAVCRGKRFRERSTLLNTAIMTFFKLDWANKEALNFICSQCGYIFWFLPQ